MQANIQSEGDIPSLGIPGVHSSMKAASTKRVTVVVDVDLFREAAAFYAVPKSGYVPMANRAEDWGAV